MGLFRSRACWKAIANGRSHADQRRPRIQFGHLYRLVDGLDVLTVFHVLNVPVIGLKPFPSILSEGQFSRAFNRDVIVVIQKDKLAKSQMTCQGGSFGRHPFHQIAIGQRAGGFVQCGLQAYRYAWATPSKRPAPVKLNRAQ